MLALSFKWSLIHELAYGLRWFNLRKIFEKSLCYGIGSNLLRFMRSYFIKRSQTHKNIRAISE